jgi:hypothetical protein
LKKTLPSDEVEAEFLDEVEAEFLGGCGWEEIHFSTTDVLASAS